MLNSVSLSGSNTNALVVVDFLDGDLSVFLGDVVETVLGRALGHVNDSLLAQLVSSPCNAAAVVAVGSGAEGSLAELFLQSGAGQVIVGHLRDVLAQFLCNVLSHCEGAAQNLESVQAEAVALVLDCQEVQAQVLSHLVQLSQRGDAVLGEALVESTCLGNVLQGHDLQLVTSALGHGIQFPFHLGFHTVLSLLKKLYLKIFMVTKLLVWYISIITAIWSNVKGFCSAVFGENISNSALKRPCFLGILSCRFSINFQENP